MILIGIDKYDEVRTCNYSNPAALLSSAQLYREQRQQDILLGIDIHFVYDAFHCISAELYSGHTTYTKQRAA